MTARSSVPEPHVPDPSAAPPAPAGTDDPAADDRPNRAARRGKRALPAHSHDRGAAPHSRGAQGRRINPVRRTG